MWTRAPTSFDYANEAALQFDGRGHGVGAGVDDYVDGGGRMSGMSFDEVNDTAHSAAQLMSRDGSVAHLGYWRVTLGCVQEVKTRYSFLHDCFGPEAVGLD